VPLVENLVKQYVSEAKYIVLLTLSMTNNTGTSNIARLIRKIKGIKERALSSPRNSIDYPLPSRNLIKAYLLPRNSEGIISIKEAILIAADTLS